LKIVMKVPRGNNDQRGSWGGRFPTDGVYPVKKKTARAMLRGGKWVWGKLSKKGNKEGLREGQPIKKGGGVTSG